MSGVRAGEETDRAPRDGESLGKRRRIKTYEVMSHSRTGNYKAGEFELVGALSI